MCATKASRTRARSASLQRLRRFVASVTVLRARAPRLAPESERRRARANRPSETKPPTNRRRPLSHVVDDGRAETGETLGGVGHGDVRVHLLLRDGTSERRGGMAEVSVAPEAARARRAGENGSASHALLVRGGGERWDAGPRPVRRRVPRSRPERAVGGGWRTAASSSSLRLREICTRMRRGTCGVDGTGGVRCCARGRGKP
jgi:hypothetical protein